MARKTGNNTKNGAQLGFENKLWEMADKLRGHIDASEYKNVVLGLIFLKFISDAFKGRVYDPCYSSGGIFMQSGKFVEIQEGISY